MNRAQSPSRRVRFTSNIVSTLGITIDLLLLSLSFFLSSFIFSFFFAGLDKNSIHETASVVLAINYLLIKVSNDYYFKFHNQTDLSSTDSLVDFIIATVLAGFTVVLFGLASRFSGVFVSLYLIITAVMIVIGHKAFRGITNWFMDAGYIGQRVAIYGADPHSLSQIMALRDREGLPHFKVIGYADDRLDRPGLLPYDSLPYLGSIEDLIDLSRQGELDQVMIVVSNIQIARFDDIIEKLSVAALDVCLVPSENLEFHSRYRVHFVGTLPVLSFWQRPIRDFDLLLKKALDLALSLAAMIILSPILLITAIAIKIESRGDILFKQRRYGFNNREIFVYKFRSMYSDRGDADGAVRTVKHDDRVTRVGRIIRRLSIDEIPQIINVFRGEMSIVGPRPHATQMRVEDEFYFDAVRGYMARHRVKPGITGWAQVRGLRGEIQTLERAKKRVEYDKYYIDNWSILLDLRIILLTVFIVIWDRDAY